MSIEPYEAEMEEAYDRLAEELYGQHKERAIDEFATERFQSYYRQNSMVMRPAVEAITEGAKLSDNKHYSAALVFYATSIELLLKATLLRPVIYGLIHTDTIAEIFVQETLKQSGFDRYEKILANLFETLIGNRLNEVYRDDAKESLLAECKRIQKIRNRIIHRGETCTPEEATVAGYVAVAVFDQIVRPVVRSIGLDVIEKGEIVAI